MRWLVTGGLGFIGSHFIRLALRERLGLQIVNLDAVTYAGNPANLEDVEKIRAIGSFAATLAMLARSDEAIAGVDAVVNFEAETHVDRSIADPEVFLTYRRSERSCCCKHSQARRPALPSSLDR